VGVELTVSKVEGKAKLSQNRSRADREGVVTGLRQSTRPNEISVAGQMTSTLDEELDDNERPIGTTSRSRCVTSLPDDPP
jgi:transcriptional regulator